MFLYGVPEAFLQSKYQDLFILFTVVILCVYYVSRKQEESIKSLKTLDRVKNEQLGLMCLFQVDDETNVLQDGTLIDLCGATLLWRSHEGLEKSPVS
jgi:hypothetical protein